MTNKVDLLDNDEIDNHTISYFFKLISNPYDLLKNILIIENVNF